MGRFDTLRPETQDMVKAMLPAIAAAFKIETSDFKDIIPQDIRMRQWDCERRDHLKDKSEDDPRNWGVEFLKTVAAIARLNGGNLAQLHEYLREKVMKHAEKHPWARLEDIRQVKAEIEKPSLRNPILVDESSSSDDSLDSYLEELVEQNLPKGMKRGNNEAYESRVQGWWKTAQQKKPKKPTRLRRDEFGGYQRRGKAKSKSRGLSSVPNDYDGDTDVAEDEHEDSHPPGPKRRRLASKNPTIKQESPTTLSDEDLESDIEAKQALLKLQTAEKELEVIRKKNEYLAKVQAAKDAKAAKAAREASASNALVFSQNGHCNDSIGLTRLPDPTSGSCSIDSNDNDDRQNKNETTGFTGFSVPGFSDCTSFRGFSQSNKPTSFAGFVNFGGFDTPQSLKILPTRQDSPSVAPADEEYDHASEESSESEESDKSKDSHEESEESEESDKSKDSNEEESEDQDEDDDE